MKPFTEVVSDEIGFLRLTRIGRWWHIFDYETSQGEWFYGTEREVADRTYVMRKANLPHSAPVPITKAV